MKRLRVPARGLHTGVFVGAGALYHYVARVHRVAVGDTVSLFDPEAGVEGDAEVVALSRESEQVSFAVAALAPGRVRAERVVRVVQGLPKGDKLDAIVRDATELGASELWLCETERAVATAPEASRLAKKLARLERIAEEAARQSGRADVTQVVAPRSLAECLAADPSELKLLLTPTGDEPLGACLRAASATTPLSFYVGPEGGFSDAEVERARAAGARVVRAGAFVLRTETVVAAILGALRVLET